MVQNATEIVATPHVHALLEVLVTPEGRADPYPTYAELRSRWRPTASWC